jgi:hypothetical protein
MTEPLLRLAPVLLRTRALRRAALARACQLLQLPSLAPQAFAPTLGAIRSLFAKL